MTLYHSTRGGCRPLKFLDTVLAGLADDGGLFVPQRVPTVDMQTLQSWKDLSYPDLSFNIMRLFIDDSEIPAVDLRTLIYKSYAHIDSGGHFQHAEVTPLVSVGNQYVLELFHGPTLAFKDVALQFLGYLFEYALKKENRKMVVVGATSGDTGSAAIHGLQGRENVECFILFPHGRVSPIQERQMTTVAADNVHCVAIDGNFDDAQAIVKDLFSDLDFKKTFSLGAINSINWARILAQIVYYFYAYFRVHDHQTRQGQEPSATIDFAVPTGNFGDILAGWYAKRLGLPVGRLVISTNENNILHRFFTNGQYHKSTVVATNTPSMDIQVSSNFERFLFFCAGEDPKLLRSWMESFQQTGKLTLTGNYLDMAHNEFISCCVTQQQTLQTIQRAYEEHGYMLDPHSAIGFYAGLQCMQSTSPMVCLATAHFGKFLDAVESAVGHKVPLPPSLNSLWHLPTRVTRLAADSMVIKKFIWDTAPLSAQNLTPPKSRRNSSVSRHVRFEELREAAHTKLLSPRNGPETALTTVPSQSDPVACSGLTWVQLTKWTFTVGFVAGVVVWLRHRLRK